MKTAMCLVLLAALLPLVGCSQGDGYDIRGDWSFRHDGEEQFALRFEGSRESGTVQQVGFGNGQGIYTLTGKDVVFNYASSDIGGRSCRFVGIFETDDAMAGTMTILAPCPPFNWNVEVEGVRL